MLCICLCLCIWSLCLCTNWQMTCLTHVAEMTLWGVNSKLSSKTTASETTVFAALFHTKTKILWLQTPPVTFPTAPCFAVSQALYIFPPGRFWHPTDLAYQADVPHPRQQLSCLPCKRTCLVQQGSLCQHCITMVVNEPVLANHAATYQVCFMPSLSACASQTVHACTAR